MCVLFIQKSCNPRIPVVALLWLYFMFRLINQGFVTTHYYYINIRLHLNVRIFFQILEFLIEVLLFYLMHE